MGGAVLRAQKLEWKFTAREFAGLPELRISNGGQSVHRRQNEPEDSLLALDELKPHFASKLNTAVQVALVLAALGPLGYAPLHELLPCTATELQRLLCMIASITTAASAASYGYTFLPKIFASGRLPNR